MSASDISHYHAMSVSAIRAGHALTVSVVSATSTAMGRWKPNALERLQLAAIELFSEHGYDRTTVGEIAARANLTERTFFRYFVDKREVLFSGAEQLEKIAVDAMDQVPSTTAPLDTVAAALSAMTPVFEQRRRDARRRQALITAHPELRERELVKLASLTSALAKRLQARGTARVEADLAAEVGLAVFKSAFARWIDARENHDLSHYIRASLVELRAMTTATVPAAPPPSGACGAS